MKGKVLMNRLDVEANKSLEKYLSQSKSGNYKREIYYHLSNYYLINDNLSKFEFYKKKALSQIKPETDRDREADVELKERSDVNIHLLKCRYLVNGGYYQRALRLLNSINYSSLPNDCSKTEYFLRLGQAQCGSSNINEGLRNLQKAIDFGCDSENHYAAEAALFAGSVNRKINNKNKAVEYWKTALAISGLNDVYIENIHKRARNSLRVN